MRYNILFLNYLIPKFYKIKLVVLKDICFVTMSSLSLLSSIKNIYNEKQRCLIKR